MDETVVAVVTEGDAEIMMLSWSTEGFLSISKFETELTEASETNFVSAILPVLLSISCTLVSFPALVTMVTTELLATDSVKQGGVTVVVTNEILVVGTDDVFTGEATDDTELVFTLIGRTTLAIGLTKFVKAFVCIPENSEELVVFVSPTELCMALLVMVFDEVNVLMVWTGACCADTTFELVLMLIDLVVDGDSSDDIGLLGWTVVDTSSVFGDTTDVLGWAIPDVASNLVVMTDLPDWAVVDTGISILEVTTDLLA